MPRIIIAASGTGGHLFPAVYVGNAIKRIAPEVAVTFVGSGRPLEAKIFSQCTAAEVRSISIVGVKHLGMRGFLKFLAMLPAAIVETWRLLSRTKPQCIIGMGGYVAVLPIVLGRLRGIPGWIHEAELHPGLANWFLSFFASKISVAFQETRMPVSKNVVVTGHPVRPGLPQGARDPARRPRNLLVMGGSQGARSLDEALPALAETLKAGSVSVVHQCRSDAVERVQQAYQAAGIEARVVGFIENMAEAYEWADVIVSRSGAGSVMEIGIVNLPSILVPYPFAQANHQLHNAHILAHAGKAIVCEEGESFKARLNEALIQVFDPTVYAEMLQAPSPYRNVDAADQIASGALKLAGFP